MTWPLKRIADIGKVVTGKTPPTNERKYFDGPYMFVTPSDLNFHHYKIYQTATTISEEGKRKLQTQFLPPNSVMYTCIGNTIGKIAISTDWCLTNQQLNSVILNDENDYQFLYYYLIYVTSYIRNLGGGVATPIVNKSTFEGVEINRPPLAIQRRIASILCGYDNLIENNLLRIKLLEEAARCEHKRLIGHASSELPLQELAIPIKRGISPKYVEQDGIAVINQKCIRTLTVDYTQARQTDKEKRIAPERMLQKFDILVNSTGTGTLGRVSICLNDNFPCTVDSHVTIVRATQETMKTYLAMSVLSQQPRISMMGEGSTNQTELSPKRLGQEIMIPAVDPEILVNFDNVVSQQLDLIWNLSTQNSKLRQARDILLPKLMSGEIDVQELDHTSTTIELPVHESMAAEDEAAYNKTYELQP